MGAENTYRNWGSNTDDLKKQCGDAVSSGCLTPPDPGSAAIMSFTPRAA